MIGNNLLITGSSRFLNPINGSCTNGTTVTTQTQSTKFMREDGTWSAPSYTAATTDKYHTTGTWSGLTYTATANGGAGALAFTIPTGTTASTVMAGNTNVNNVTQTATDSTNATYELLFSGTADNTTRNEGARKTSGLTFNPSTGALNVSGSLNFASTSLTSSMDAQGLTVTQTGNSVASIAYGTIGISDRSDSISMSSSDISLSSKWDGINTSLKTAVTGAKGTVTQTVTDSTTSATDYEILFSGTADNTNRTEGARKSSKLLFSPIGSFFAVKHNDDNALYYSGNAGYLQLVSQNDIATIQLKYKNSSGTDVGTNSIKYNDITLTGTDNTWDGTNTSLKTTLSNKLSLDGSNQMTGNLTLDGRNVFSKRSDVTIGKTANNGVTTSAYNSYQLRDSADTMYGMTQYCANSNGNVYTSIHAHNMTTGGADVDNALYVYANKDGTLTYAVTDKPNFRAAIGLADLGNIYSATKSASITTANIDSHVEGATITLGIGKYIIFGQWAFNSASGARVTKCRLYNKTTATDMSQTRVAQGAGNYCVLQAIAFANITTNNTVIAVTGAATVTSGSAGTSILAIKIL